MKPFGLAWMVALAACGGSEAPISFDQPVTLTASGKGAGGLRAQIVGATVVPTEPLPVLDLKTGDDPGWSSLAVQGLALGLRTRDGRAWLDEARMPLEDVRVYGAALPAAGVQLRNLALRIQGPTRVEVTHAAANSLSMTATLGVALEWQLELDDGTLYPLGNVPLGPMEVRIGAMRPADADPVLSLFGLCAAPCGGIEELFSIGQVMWMVSGPVVAR